MFYNITQLNLLPFIISIPILGILCILLMDEEKLSNNIKLLSTWASAFAFLLTSIFLYLSTEIKLSHFALEITVFITMICVLTSKDEIINDVKKFHILLLFLESLLLCIFSTSSIITFFVLLELIVIIAFFLMGSFSKKSEIAFKFLFSQLCGSIFIFFAAVYIVSITGTAEIDIISKYTFSINQERIIFLTFLIGFAFQSILFPKIHEQTTASISVFLSGVFFIIGIFGIITILMPIAKNSFCVFQKYILYLSIITMTYAVITASQQTDLKKNISYISLVHISIIIIGVFSCNINGIAGAFFNAISHSFIIPMMYIVTSIIENRFGDRNANNLSNISRSFLSLSCFALIPILSVIFTPLFPCFSGFILIISGYFPDHFLSTAVVCFITLCGSFHAIKVYANMFFREENSSKKQSLNNNELICLAHCLLGIILIGIFQKNIISAISYSISFIDGGINDF